jgi:hypothetical protein
MRTRLLVILILMVATGRAEADATSEIALARDAEARGLPLAALFHAARAKQLGGEISVAQVDVDALWIDLPTRPQISVPEECEWLRDPIESAYPSASANVVIDARLTCTAASNTWTENQAYVWYTTEQHEETQTVPGKTTRSMSNCWDNSIPRKMYACWVDTVEPETTAQVTVTDQIPHDATHDVTRRTMALTVRGTLSSSGARADIAFDRAVDEIEFSDEHGAQAFSTTGDDLVREAMGAIKVGINELIAPVRKAQIEVELAAAGSAGDTLGAEEHRLRAWTLGDPASTLAKAYGLTEPQLADLRAAGGLQVPGERLVTLFQQETAAQEPEPPRGPRRPSLLGRVFSTPRLTLARTTRLDGGLTSIGYGARIELGWRLRRTLDYALGLAVGGDRDSEHGSEYDARAGVAVGLSSKRYQLAYLIGIGVTGAGVRMPGATASTLETQGNAFHGVDLRLRGKPLGFDGRILQLRGGPLGDGMRASAQVLLVVGRVVIGVEGSINQYDGAGDAKITGVGLTLGLEQPSSGASRRR